MSGLAQLFAGVNFQSTIQRYCGLQGWSIADLNPNTAVLRFGMESGRTQILYVLKFDATLEFSVQSDLRFDSVDAVPGYLSTLLLKRNCEKKIGFWCLEEIGSKHIFSHMHNAEMSLIDGDYFAKVVRALIREVDELEEVIFGIGRRH